MRQNGGHLAAVLHTQKPRPYNAQFSEHHDQQHFELLLTEDGVGMARGHDDGLALVQLVGRAVDGDASRTVEAGDKRVAAGFMRADLLALVKGEQGDADGIVLRQGLADHLAFLIGNLFL